MTVHPLSTRERPKPYLCYVHRPDRAISDLTVLTCSDDHAVEAALDAALDGWPSFTRIDVYDGDRPVLSRNGPLSRQDLGRRAKG